MDLLDETFTRLSHGDWALIPKFEFARQMRNDSQGTLLKLDKDEVAIFEGIHALNDDIAGRHPEATTLYISARSSIMDEGEVRFKGTWLRIARRCVRDYNFRGTDMIETMSMWHNVRRGEKKFISPFKNRAKIVIDSSVPYGPSVFANYSQPLRQALELVPQDNKRYQELHDMVEALRHFIAVNPELVPAESLVREFIGGGVYSY